MSNPIKLHFKDYRILKDVDIEIDGITLVCGENDSGKSTIMRGMDALVRNASSEAHINDMADEMSVTVSFPGDYSVRYRRNRKGTAKYEITKPDGTTDVAEKLNRASLATVDPNSPFKVLTFGESKFNPNFVFQSEIPVWGQVDAYAFFASMFGPISVIYDHVLATRTKLSEVSKAVNLAESKVNGAVELITGAKEALATLPPETEINLASLAIQDYGLKMATAQSVQEELDSTSKELEVLADHHQLYLQAKQHMDLVAWLDPLERAYGHLNSLSSSLELIQKSEVESANVTATAKAFEGFDQLMASFRSMTTSSRYLQALRDITADVAMSRAEYNGIAQVVSATSHENLKALVDQVQAVGSANVLMARMRVPRVNVEYVKGLSQQLGTAMDQLPLFQVIGKEVSSLASYAGESQKVSMEAGQVQSELAEIKVCPLCSTALGSGIHVHQ